MPPPPVHDEDEARMADADLGLRSVRAAVGAVVTLVDYTVEESSDLTKVLLRVHKQRSKSKAPMRKS